MSYKLYLDGLEMEVKDINRIAQTKQVNNITNLHTRQSNSTNTWSLPKTPTNTKNLEWLGIVGNKSNKPYSKITANLLDTITGDWLIYNGWAIINETNKDFKVSLYDGIIDFYKAIDNKKLTEIGISDLNHVKNIQNIKDSWADDLPYLYILSDYNGKLITDNNNINIDYQIPSARISYIWNRIHLFSGFTYEGAVFSTEKFLNWFMTYPKPITEETIVVNNVTTQLATIETYYDEWTFTTISWTDTRPNDFSNIYAEHTGLGGIYILTAGVYRLTVAGVNISENGFTSGRLMWYIRDANAVILDNGIIDSQGNDFVFLNLEVGQILIYATESSGGSTGILTKLDYVIGYGANFDEALIDFTATEFYKEVLNHFALVPFKNKYSNHIVYKTLDEILQEEDVADWSSKNPVRLSEKYIVGTYAQSNTFKYKYNDNNEYHYDGSILLDNKNLKENTVVVSSKFFAPDNADVTILGYRVPLMPIWTKELKDDGSIEYKELTGRYYTHRARRNINFTTFTLESELLNVTDTVYGNIPISSYYRLTWKQILTDNYSNLSQILNTSKMVEANVFLTSTDVANFDFKRLVYIDQFSSYYLVNKISNFIRGKYTKVELIEVDYFVDGDQIDVAPYTFINIVDMDINGCTFVITIDTNATFPVELTLQINQQSTGTFYNVLTEYFTITATSNVITFVYSGYPIIAAIDTLQLWLGAQNFNTGISSNIVNAPLDTCNNVVSGTFLTLESLTVIEIIEGFLGSSDRRLQVVFDTDVVLPTVVRFIYTNNFGYPQYYDVTATTNTFEVLIPNNGWFSCNLKIGQLVSNSIIME
jgi:hypothetical protein